MKNLFFLFALLIIPFLINAQTSIQGTVFNKSDSTAIDYCGVYLQDVKVGTITNEAGKFQIFVDKVSENEMVKVSCLGYKTQIFDFSKFEKEQQIYLEVDTVMIPVEMDLSETYDLLYDALFKNSVNYISKPAILKGYQQMETIKDDSLIADFYQSIFEIYYGKEKPRRQFKLLKHRYTSNYDNVPYDFTLSLSPIMVYVQDIVLHSEIHLLDKKGMYRHGFKVVGIVNVDGKPAYKVLCEELYNVKKQAFRGYFLIDKKTLAFIYFELALTPISAYKTSTRKSKIIHDLYRTYYHKVDDKYCLQYSIRDIKFFRSSKNLGNYFMQHQFTHVMTSIETENPQPFDKKENIRPYIEFNYKETNSDWTNENIILQTQPFEELKAIFEPENKN